MLRLRMGYPTPTEEIVILDEQKRTHPLDDLSEVCSVAELREMQTAVREIYVDASVSEYIVRLVNATRTHPDVYLGASPRGSIALYRSGQARAALLGRDYVIPDDVKILAATALAHRLIIKTSSSIREVDAETVVRELLETIPVDAPARPGGAAADRPRGGSGPVGPASRSGAVGRCASCGACLPGRRHGPRADGLQHGRALPLLPRLPWPRGPRRQLPRHPRRPDRPRGRLRGQPAAGPRGRGPPGDVHAAQHEPHPQALAGGPQPDDAAGAAAGPGHLPGPQRRAIVDRQGAAQPPRPLPGGPAADPDGRPVSASSRPARPSGTDSPSSSTRAWSRSRAGASRPPTWRGAVPSPSGPSRRRPWRRAFAPTRRATASTGSTGRRRREPARSR